MDLDNIKKTWQETKIKSSIDEDKIRKMISNDGQSAYRGLLGYEKLGIFIVAVCIPLGYFVFSKHMPLTVFFIVSTVLILAWQIYKYMHLRKMDMAQMSITQISGHFYWYRKAILYELISGAVWLILFVVFYAYSEFAHDSVHFVRRIIILIVSLIVVQTIALLLFKKFLWSKMKKLEVSIKEVEEFEQDNVE